MPLAISGEALLLVAVIVFLAGVLRWSFSERPRRKADYGLLHEVATAPSERAARFVRDQLRRNGIRATIAPGEGGLSRRVLVFPADAGAAAELLLRENSD